MTVVLRLVRCGSRSLFQHMRYSVWAGLPSGHLCWNSSDGVTHVTPFGVAITGETEAVRRQCGV